MNLAVIKTKYKKCFKEKRGGVEVSFITKEELTNLYKHKKMTDSEISKLFNVDRTNVVHLRKKYNIESNNDLSRKSVEIVKKILQDKGFKVINMNREDATHPFDLLINDNIRVEVMSSTICRDSIYRFTFAYQEKLNYIESEHRIKLSNNRLKKLYRKTCDFLILCGFNDNNDNIDFWVMPSGTIKDKMQTLSLIPFSKRSKYRNFERNWGVLEDSI